MDCQNGVPPMTTETAIVQAIVTKALKEGYTCHVDNGDGWEKPAQNVKTIVEELTCTGESHLHVSKQIDAEMLGISCKVSRKGTIFFVFGNSPEELICDYSDNETINSLIAAYV